MEVPEGFTLQEWIEYSAEIDQIFKEFDKKVSYEMLSELCKRIEEENECRRQSASEQSL